MEEFSPALVVSYRVQLQSNLVCFMMWFFNVIVNAQPQNLNFLLLLTACHFHHIQNLYFIWMIIKYPYASAFWSNSCCYPLANTWNSHDPIIQLQPATQLTGIYSFFYAPFHSLLLDFHHAGAFPFDNCSPHSASSTQLPSALHPAHAPFLIYPEGQA